MNDGGLAFPGRTDDQHRAFLHSERDGENNLPFKVVEHPGMSLRDYFAIHASDATIQTFMVKNGWSFSLISNAEARYRFADAMLLARTNKTT